MKTDKRGISRKAPGVKPPYDMEILDCVGVGLCVFDHLCLLKKYPGADDKIVALEHSTQGGGPVATAMATLGRLGARTAFVGRVGDDTEGRFVIHELERMGVDASRVIVGRGAKTPTAFCWVEKGTGRRAVTLAKDGKCSLSARDIREPDFPRARFLLIDGRDADACLKAARITSRRGGRVVLDIGSPRRRMDEIFSATDFFIASHMFIRKFHGRVKPETACRKILARGPETAVITLGAEGSIVANRDGLMERVPAFTRPGWIVDTTGAGDVFHGAFVHGLIRGWDVRRCALFANAAAFLKCGSLGGRAGIPTVAQVNRLIRESGR